MARTRIPEADVDDLDLRDYDEIDEEEARLADQLRALVTGLPARPGTQR